MSEPVEGSVEEQTESFMIDDGVSAQAFANKQVVTPTDGHPAPCNVAATSENEHEGSTPTDCDVDTSQDLENEAGNVGPSLVPTDPVGVTTADSLSEQTLSAVGVDQTVEVAVESNVGQAMEDNEENHRPAVSNNFVDQLPQPATDVQSTVSGTIASTSAGFRNIHSMVTRTCTTVFAALPPLPWFVALRLAFVLPFFFSFPWCRGKWPLLEPPKPIVVAVCAALSSSLLASPLYSRIQETLVRKGMRPLFVLGSGLD
ncbi:hypothetical protein V6N11_001717 [Hibiscus sabdariffa]|uniref:Uncharacterized protein n=2 Tax=Hibiscus sabdariffa TaxID=183260 RepID=A0ABR2G4Q2_9ROSI